MFNWQCRRPLLHYVIHQYWPPLDIAADPYLVQFCLSLFCISLLTLTLHNAVHPYFVHWWWPLCCTMLLIPIWYSATDHNVVQCCSSLFCTSLLTPMLYNAVYPYFVQSCWPVCYKYSTVHPYFIQHCWSLSCKAPLTLLEDCNAEQDFIQFLFCPSLSFFVCLFVPFFLLRLFW